MIGKSISFINRVSVSAAAACPMKVRLNAIDPGWRVRTATAAN
jgi:hypothetical protein